MSEQTAWIIIIIAVANIPTFLVAGKVFFGDFHSFLEALERAVSDELNEFDSDPRRRDDYGAMFQIFIFLTSCAMVIGTEIAVYHYTKQLLTS